MSYHPLSWHQSLKICMNFSQFLRGSFADENHGSMTATPLPDKDAIISCILISGLQEACNLAEMAILTPCCKRGNTTKGEMDATSIQHPLC